MENIAATVHQSAERAERPNKEAEPCKPGDDRRYSDLCAQWKAADAAADSAWWAWVSGAVGIGSLVGVVVALGLALHSNWIARDTAQRQLRAYLMVDYGGHYALEVGKPVTAVFGIKNVGQTPALYFLGHIRAVLALAGDEPDYSTRTMEIAEIGGEFLGPSKVNQFRSVATAKLTKSDLAALEAGKKVIYVSGLFRYQDIFKKWHFFEINHRSDPDLKIRGHKTNGRGALERDPYSERTIQRWLRKLKGASG